MVLGFAARRCHARRVDCGVERSESDCPDNTRDQAYGRDSVSPLK